MANYNGRVSRQYDVPARTVTQMFIQCAACGTQDLDGSGLNFWRCIPPIAGWDSSAENWMCLPCVNKVNAIFGVPAKEA